MDVLIFIVLIAVILLGWIRYSPSDPDVWHVDPADDDIHKARVKLIGQEAPRFPGEADEVLENFQQIALSDPGVRLLDGSIEEGMITFVVRGGGLGLRDYITVKAAIDVDGTKLSVLGRPKYAFLGSDSQARIDRWLTLLDQLYRS